MVARTQVFGSRSRVIVDIDEEKARRVFVRFADEDAKKRAQKVLVAAKAGAPVGKTGELRNSIELERSRDVRGRWETGWDVISKAPHTMFVIRGTRPHRIEPKTEGGVEPKTEGGVLSFLVPGGRVFVKWVNHPGTRANNFLSRALRAAR